MKKFISFIFIAITINIYSIAQQENQFCNPEDWAALKAFYESTNGNNWLNQAGWDEIIRNQPQPPKNCKLTKLQGVKLYKDRVSFLSLPDNNLVGNIPEEIGKLKSLFNLELENNKLIGFIPPEIGNFTKLKILNLSNNQLNGNIPPEIGELCRVEKLNLRNNQLSGDIPAGVIGLKRVESLSLAQNRLTGIIPSELSHLTQLKTLSLHSNQLSGCYDIELKKLCEQLEARNINMGNNFDSSWKEFCNNDAGSCEVISQAKCFLEDWQALKALYINTNGDMWKNRAGWDTIIAQQKSITANCDLDKLFGVSLDTSGRVVILSLEKNNLTGSIPDDIQKLTNLETLILKNNNLEGSIPHQISDLKKLVHVNLSNNQLSGCYHADLFMFCQKLSKQSNLSEGNNFDVSWHDLCENDLGVCNSLPNCHMLDWVALKTLYNNAGIKKWSKKFNWDTLFNNQLIPPANCHLDSLYGVSLNNEGRVNNLNLSKKSLYCKLPEEIGNLRFLDTLNLASCGLKKFIPTEIGKLTSLRSLNLSQNGLEGFLPNEIQHLKNLTELDLHQNSFEGAPFEQLVTLPKLKKINISRNRDRWQDGIPNNIGNLLELEYLNLYDTQLNGEIPNNIGKLKKLEYLNLSNNQLKGDIPQNIGDMKALQYLNLAKNELVGVIPTEIVNLVNLKNLQLQSNQLSGTIPYNIGHLINLFELNISENTLEGAIPASFIDLAKLEQVSLYDNKFIPCFDSKLSFFCENPLKGIHSLGYCWIEFCELGFTDCGVYIPDCQCYPDEWAVLKKLYEKTNGSNWNYNENWDATFANKSIPPKNCDLNKLHGIYLNTRGKVESLSLVSNNLRGPLIPEISQLIHLKELNLHNNHLTGNVPKEIGDLKKLKKLDIGNNKLTGTIPKSIIINSPRFNFLVWDKNLKKE